MREVCTIDACTLRGYVRVDGGRIWICGNAYGSSPHDIQVEAIMHRFLERYVAVEIRYTGPPMDDVLEGE